MMTKTCESCGMSIVPQGMSAHRSGLRCTVRTAVKRRVEQGYEVVPSQRGMTAALRAVEAQTVTDYVAYSPGSKSRRASASQGVYAPPAAIITARMVLWHAFLLSEARRRGRAAKRARAEEQIFTEVGIDRHEAAWKYVNRHPDGSLRSYWNDTWVYRAGQPISDGPPKVSHQRGIYVCRTRQDACVHGRAPGRVLVLGRADYVGCIDYEGKVAVREFTPICIVE